MILLRGQGWGDSNNDARKKDKISGEEEGGEDHREREIREM